MGPLEYKAASVNCAARMSLNEWLLEPYLISNDINLSSWLLIKIKRLLRFCSRAIDLLHSHPTPSLNSFSTKSQYCNTIHFLFYAFSTMSAHLNSSHTMTPHTAGATGDDRRRKPQRNLRAPDSSSFNITQTDDLFNQAAPPPHHHVQTHIELRCPNVPGFLERPCQYPCDAGNWYNTPTTVGRWDLTTAVQPGIVAPDQLYQAGTQQENVPSNRFAVPGLMNQSTRPANSPAEEYAALPAPGTKACS